LGLAEREKMRLTEREKRALLEEDEEREKER
jgi:hypothetical protein